MAEICSYKKVVVVKEMDVVAICGSKVGVVKNKVVVAICICKEGEVMIIEVVGTCRCMVGVVMEMEVVVCRRKEEKVGICKYKGMEVMHKLVLGIYKHLEEMVI